MSAEEDPNNPSWMRKGGKVLCRWGNHDYKAVIIDENIDGDEGLFFTIRYPGWSKAFDEDVLLKNALVRFKKWTREAETEALKKRDIALKEEKEAKLRAKEAAMAPTPPVAKRKATTKGKDNKDESSSPAAKKAKIDTDEAQPADTPKAKKRSNDAEKKKGQLSTSIFRDKKEIITPADKLPKPPTVASSDVGKKGSVRTSAVDKLPKPPVVSSAENGLVKASSDSEKLVFPAKLENLVKLLMIFPPKMTIDEALKQFVAKFSMKYPNVEEIINAVKTDFNAHWQKYCNEEEKIQFLEIATKKRDALGIPPLLDNNNDEEVSYPITPMTDDMDAIYLLKFLHDSDLFKNYLNMKTYYPILAELLQAFMDILPDYNAV